MPHVLLVTMLLSRRDRCRIVAVQLEQDKLPDQEGKDVGERLCRWVFKGVLLLREFAHVSCFFPAGDSD